MPKQHEILGKNLSPEAKKEVVALLDEYTEKGQKSFEGELEKPKKDLRFIKGVVNYVNRRLEKIGLERTFQINYRQIHFLPGQVYEAFIVSTGGGLDSIAHFEPFDNAIFINMDKEKSKEELYKTIVHEMLHMASFQKVFVRESKEVFHSRIGYENLSKKQKNSTEEKRDIYFTGFNEAITDAMTEALFFKHKDTLQQKFGIDFEQIKLTYRPYIAIVNIIANKLAVEGKESTQEIYKRFERGFFSGDMMHLRRIERVFGKNALRVLGVLGCADRGFSDEGIFKKVLRFFRSEDRAERMTIAHELLDKKIMHD